MSDIESDSHDEEQVTAIALWLKELSKKQDERFKEDEPKKPAAMVQIEPTQTKRPCLQELLEEQLSERDDPKDSRYYSWYVAKTGFNEVTSFQQMFGIPDQSYKQLLSEVQFDNFLHMWLSNSDSTEPLAPPVELLLLSSLRALKVAKGRRIKDMDEVEEDDFLDVSLMCAITPELMHHFFHHFMSYGSTTLYQKYVANNSTVTTKSMYEHVNNFAKAGIFGNLDAKAKKRIKDIQKRVL